MWSCLSHSSTERYTPGERCNTYFNFGDDPVKKKKRGAAAKTPYSVNEVNDGAGDAASVSSSGSSEVDTGSSESSTSSSSNSEASTAADEDDAPEVFLVLR